VEPLSLIADESNEHESIHFGFHCTEKRLPTLDILKTLICLKDVLYRPLLKDLLKSYFVLFMIAFDRGNSPFEPCGLILPYSRIVECRLYVVKKPRECKNGKATKDNYRYKQTEGYFLR
jgi:hypothetical protein